MTRQQFRRRLAKAAYVNVFVTAGGLVQTTKAEALRWMDTALSDHTRRPDLYPCPVVYLPDGDNGRVVIGCHPDYCPNPFEEVTP